MAIAFTASLLREKFIIRDLTGQDMDGEPLTALSNRLTVPLGLQGGTNEENLVVRSQNMHNCARFAARILQEYNDHGSLIHRAKKFDWMPMWEAVTDGYEHKWNKQKWIAVYHKGRVVFEAGEGSRHPFCDIIEQCDAVNNESYDESLRIAEDAFLKAGKTVRIEYDSNIALVMQVMRDEGKCGVIVRGPNRTTTFNFTAKAHGPHAVKPAQCLSAAAAFLEGIQLAFTVGVANVQQEMGLMDKSGEEARMIREATQKLSRLNSAVQQFENMLDVTYRPERPEFPRLIEEAALFARTLIKREIAAKRDSNTKDSGE